MGQFCFIGRNDSSSANSEAEMKTEIILSDINYIYGISSFLVRFSVVCDGITLARLDTDISGQVEDETFQAILRNRIHEITELLDDWIRHDRPIRRA